MPDEKKTPKRTARLAIMERLRESGKPLAVHELNIYGHSENAMATELSDMARDGLVVGKYREGFKYKEWTLVSLPGQMDLGLA